MPKGTEQNTILNEASVDLDIHSAKKDEAECPQAEESDDFRIDSSCNETPLHNSTRLIDNLNTTVSIRYRTKNFSQSEISIVIGKDFCGSYKTHNLLSKKEAGIFLSRNVGVYGPGSNGTVTVGVKRLSLREIIVNELLEGDELSISDIMNSVKSAFLFTGSGLTDMQVDSMLEHPELKSQHIEVQLKGELYEEPDWVVGDSMVVAEHYIGEEFIEGQMCLSLLNFYLSSLAKTQGDRVLSRKLTGHCLNYSLAPDLVDLGISELIENEDKKVAQVKLILGPQHASQLLPVHTLETSTLGTLTEGTIDFIYMLSEENARQGIDDPYVTPFNNEIIDLLRLFGGSVNLWKDKVTRIFFVNLEAGQGGGHYGATSVTVVDAKAYMLIADSMDHNQGRAAWHSQSAGREVIYDALERSGIRVVCGEFRAFFQSDIVNCALASLANLAMMKFLSRVYVRTTGERVFIDLTQSTNVTFRIPVDSKQLSISHVQEILAELHLILKESRYIIDEIFAYEAKDSQLTKEVIEEFRQALTNNLRGVLSKWGILKVEIRRAVDDITDTAMLSSCVQCTEGGSVGSKETPIDLGLYRALDSELAPAHQVPDLTPSVVVKVTAKSSSKNLYSPDQGTGA